MSEPIQSPKEILKELVINSGAMTSLLITKEGHSIAEAGNLSYLNSTALAALVAGMFSATREVARLVGEQQFSILLQQGDKRHIHISLVTAAAMMVIIFEDYAKVGMIRYAARKAGTTLSRVLAEMDRMPKRLTVPQKEVTEAGLPGGPQEPEPEREVEIPTFKEYALNLIDRIFETGD